MHAATARPEIARLLDLMEESHRAVRAAHSTAGWMDLDLTLGQLRFLHSLNRAGSLSMGHVAEQLGVTLTTASQFVNRLERRGYVERLHRDDDRRVVECRLSDRGAEITAAMRGMQRDVLAALLANLKPRELKILERLYRLMLERAAEAPTQAPQRLRPAAGVLAAGRGA
jgi:DNA-binding MarR family transcriptional regulator